MSHNRLINVTLHDLTSPQALDELIHLFGKDSTKPVVLLTKRGQGAAFIGRIRTELGRIRKQRKQEKLPMTAFGFTATGPIPLSLDGQKLEGYALGFRLTQLQLFRNLANKSGVEL